VFRFVAPAKLPIAAGVIGTWVTSRESVVLNRDAIGSNTAGRRVFLVQQGRQSHLQDQFCNLLVMVLVMMYGRNGVDVRPY
jgi:hypothetical protein